MSSVVRSVEKREWLVNLLVNAVWLAVPAVFVLVVAAGLIRPGHAHAAVRARSAEDHPGHLPH